MIHSIRQRLLFGLLAMLPLAVSLGLPTLRVGV